MLYYPVPSEFIPDQFAWPILDPIMDDLLHGSLPFQFVKFIASSYSVMDRVYGNQISDSDEISNSPSCYMKGKMSSITIDWKAGYKNNSDTNILYILV